MKNDINFTIKSGNLTADAVYRQNQNGGGWYTGRIAVNRTYFSQKTNSEAKETFFVEFQYNSRNANLTQYLKKGTAVIIEGEDRERTYTDQQGAQRTVHYIQVKELRLLPSAGGHQQNAPKPQQTAPAPAPQPGPEAFQDDSLPF